jgi:hypothetical protein
LHPGELLYVTPNGILEPLGYSQVARVLFGLARRGFRYHLLSLERAKDVDDLVKMAEVSAQLATHGISWTWRRYDARSTATSVTNNLAWLMRMATELRYRKKIRLLHARGYHAGLIGLTLRRATRLPYLFDARGRWVDERIAAGRWFAKQGTQLVARGLERSLYRNASALVTLTRLHAQDIEAGVFGGHRGQEVSVIPTCADYDDFNLERRAAPAAELPNALRALGSRPILALVGSKNPSYRYDASLELARRVMGRRPDVHLLVLTAQQDVIRKDVVSSGIELSRTTILTAAHADMPRFLARIDWAIQLLSEDVAKRGSMPTKLAEFFAAGVRPIHYGCNGEVTGWVRTAGSGYVLGDLSDAELDKAATFVAESPTSAKMLADARASTEAHFALESGIARYEALLTRLLV